MDWGPPALGNLSLLFQADGWAWVSGSDISPMTAPLEVGTGQAMAFPGRMSPMCRTLGSAGVMLIAMVTVLTIASQNDISHTRPAATWEGEPSRLMRAS